MTLYLADDGLRYTLEHIVRLFSSELTLAHKRPAYKGHDGGDFCYIRHVTRKKKVRFFVALRMQGTVETKTCLIPEETAPADQKLLFSSLLFSMLVKRTGHVPPWGILTGVRPAKLMRAWLEEGCGPEQAEARFRERYLVRPDKAALAREAAEATIRYAAPAPNSCSVYISIPFCPSRCSYCSFVSKTTERDAAELDDYLSALAREMRLTSDLIRKQSLTVDTIYIGGGTPTILDERQLATLLRLAKELFYAQTVREFSVEAGRPDTITFDKLCLMRDYGVDRISVNPQTMDDDLLRSIGRRHGREDILRAFDEARKAGFSDINADLIAGLPGDTPEGFFRSLSSLVELEPAGITIHALSYKRASDFSRGNRSLSRESEIMVSGGCKRLLQEGYRPYYLYKQKMTVGNLENVGYAREGFHGLYNMLIMDERQDILSCGAGGVTKLWNGGTGEIRRTWNHKYPQEYMREIETILTRKQGIIANEKKP